MGTAILLSVIIYGLVSLMFISSFDLFLSWIMLNLISMVFVPIAIIPILSIIGFLTGIFTLDIIFIIASLFFGFTGSLMTLLTWPVWTATYDSFKEEMEWCRR